MRANRTCTHGMFVIAVLLPVAACDPDRANPSTDGNGFAVRDSGGLSIVENTVANPPALPHWRIDSTPAVTIGTSIGEPPYEFTRIGGVRQLPNGMVVALNGRGELEYEIRFYDSTGRHVATHGRLGQGPGEFRSINYFGSVGGDTVIAVDWVQQRASWVSASAGYLRGSRLDELQFKTAVGDDGYGILEGLVPFGDSLYAVRAFRRIAGAATPFHRGQSYHIVDMAAGTRHDLRRIDDEPRKYVQLSTGRTSVRPAGTGDAMHVVDPARRRICAAVTNVAEVWCLDATGQRRIIRWRADVVPYTDDDHAAYERAVHASIGPRSGRTAGDASILIAARERPERHNPILVLLIDTEGNLWVQELFADAAGKRGSRFRIFDVDGRQIAFADPFPAQNFNSSVPQHIGAGAVVRIIRDADDVEMVGVFRIRKSVARVPS